MLKYTFGEKFDTPCALVLGGFDGLHLGHRALLDAAKKTGLPVCLSTMLGGKGKVLFTASERERLFSCAGVDRLLEIPFTQELKETSAEDFLKKLFGTVPAEVVLCGEDFRFGRGAEGDAKLLKCYAKTVLIQETVNIVAKESGRAEKLSSTLCKAYLEKGDLSALNACLATEDFFGSAYFIEGEVEHGRMVGRTYGFPTLNLTPPGEKLLPPDGVYGGLAETPKGNFPMILNIGARPTFGVAERKLEAYLDGFSGDLYGETVRLFPTQFFRPIQKFPSPEALRSQLERDISRLREELTASSCPARTF